MYKQLFVACLTLASIGFSYAEFNQGVFDEALQEVRKPQSVCSPLSEGVLVANYLTTKLATMTKEDPIAKVTADTLIALLTTGQGVGGISERPANSSEIMVMITAAREAARIQNEKTLEEHFKDFKESAKEHENQHRACMVATIFSAYESRKGQSDLPTIMSDLTQVLPTGSWLIRYVADPSSKNIPDYWQYRPHPRDLIHLIGSESGHQWLNLPEKKKSSLKDVIAYVMSAKKIYDDPGFWEALRLAYMPGSDLKFFKEDEKEDSKEEEKSGPESLKKFKAIRSAIFIARYVQRKFHEMIQKPTKIIQDEELMKRIEATYTPDYVTALKGYLLMMEPKTRKEGLKNLEKAGEAVSRDAQKWLNIAVRNGEFGFTAATGRQYLEGRIAKGDQHAQEMFNLAAIRGELGFTAETGLQYLEQRAANGDQNAQERLNNVACFGWCGFTAVTGRQYLESRAANGDQNAQEWLNMAANDRQLGFTAETGLQYLEQRAANGDQNAQETFNAAVSDRKFGFTAKTGRQYLKSRAANGDQNAQEKLNIAACFERLGFIDETGLQYLESRAANGDQHAQEWLNMAANDRQLGFTVKTGRQYLESRAANGDQNAQQRLNMAARNRRLGFTDETGLQYLESRAANGDHDAQKRLTNTTWERELFFIFYNALYPVK